MTQSIDDKNLLAQRIIAHMYGQDRLAQHFNMQLVETGHGFAKLEMLIKAEMLNGHGICHGGVTFALADTAFAYACNSQNQKTVALNCLISYSQAVNEGDLLTATAREEVRTNRTGTYDVKISNQNSAVVALFRGTSYSTKAPVVADLETGLPE